MKVLDLFAGIGGFSLGLERAGFETVAFCEIDPYAQQVLHKHWPEVPLYDDVRELTADRLARDGISVDVITGGFPCQDISNAGQKQGISGPKSSLWGEIFRLASELRPRYLLVENVAVLLSRGAGNVFSDLASIGYGFEWHCISAASLGAPHIRDRFWLVAYPDHQSQSLECVNDEARGLPEAGRAILANAKPRQREVGWLLAGIRGQRQSSTQRGCWKAEDSPIGMGVDDGIPARMDRLKCLGNAVVPQIPELIGRAILDYERKQRAED